MTSLIGWTGVDNRGPASFYIASDSRLSKSSTAFDFGRKVFSCQNSPDIFGFCGAVLFPSQFIGQLIQSIDSGEIFPSAASPEQRLQTIEGFVRNAVSGYPEQDSFKIAYATRVGDGFGSHFFAADISWNGSGKLTTKIHPVPCHDSDLVFAAGSGKPVVDDYQFEWRNSDVGRTSRAVYSSFCEAIASGRDAYTGGPPQLVGLHLLGPAKTFGTIHEGECYINGLRVPPVAKSKLQCFDELFHRCDMFGTTKGQRHAKPA